MLILKKGHQPGVYVPLRALFLVGRETCMYLEPRSGTEGINVYGIKCVRVKSVTVCSQWLWAYNQTAIQC